MELTVPGYTTTIWLVSLKLSILPGLANVHDIKDTVACGV